MASKKYLKIFPQNGCMVIDLGEMEIWDGADLALLRESLTRLIRTDKCRSVGVQMSHVKYIPSGFFGMLFDWYEQGVRIRLFSPQPNVARMLWFSRFFQPISEGVHELHPDSTPPVPTGYGARQEAAVEWNPTERSTSVAGISNG